MTILGSGKAVIPYNSKHRINSILPLPKWIVGLELEIENMPQDDFSFGGVTFTTDGSLRETEYGVGIEVITKPIEIQCVEGLLNAFFMKYDITNFNYSERCSTHVHFNVEPLEWEQLASICLVYQTVERLLFKFVGGNRENNIFCVPWNQCTLGYDVVYNLARYGQIALKQWQKYTALNLLPVIAQGTIEFRHLGGTCDVKKIITWISLIAKIFAYAMALPLQTVKNDIMNMNTISNYQEWLGSIFGLYTECLQYPGYEKEISLGVIDSKLMIASEMVKQDPDDIRAQHLFFSRSNDIYFTVPGDGPPRV